MTDNILPLEEESYFDLISFFVSSAYLLHDSEAGDPLYPPLRLLEGATRLTKAIISSGGFANDTWPSSFVEKCEKGFDYLMTDREKFREFIGEATQMLAEEVKRRG